MTTPQNLTECPKCGFKGLNQDQCDRCGIIFDRMHTVLDTQPLGSAMAAAREAYIAQQRAAKAGQAAPSGPTVMVAHDAKTVVDTPRIVANKPGLAGAAAALDRVKVNPHASTIPAQSPVAPKPGRVGIELVAPDRPKSRTKPLLVLLGVALAAWGVSELNARREARIAASRPAPAVVVPEAPKPVEGMTAQDLSLGGRALLADLRRDFTRIGDPTAAREQLRAAQSRLDHLKTELPGARLSPIQRSAYGRGLSALGDFLSDTAPRAIDAAQTALGEPPPIDLTPLEAAERAFLDGDRAPPPEN